MTGQKRRVTAADVATLADVSRSAVSRAFTEGAYLDADKKTRILKAADELGYRPNALAASLQGAGSNLVAIFVGEMPNQYDKEVATALINGLNAAGKWPIVVGGSGDAAKAAIQNVLRYPLESMILRSGSLGADVVSSCLKLGIPVISSGRILEGPNVDNICVQNRAAMAMMTKHLIKQGRRKFAYLSGPDAFWSTGERYGGFEETLKAHSLETVSRLYGDYSVMGGFNAIKACSDLKNIDALVCANDAMAIGALMYLKEQGVIVPDQIAVTGFDNISMAEWPSFSLTTLHNPIEPLVEGTIALLLARDAEPDRVGETKWLEAELVLRSTHGT